MSRSGRPPAPPDPPEATRPVPARLVLARHAQSTWNDLGKIQGQLDPPLSERGRELAELREIFLGEWEGLTRHDLEVRYPELWQRWLQRPDWDVVPGGEGTGAFERRVNAILKRLLDAHPEGDVLAVTHGGVIQVAIGHTVGRDSAGLFPFRIGNA